MKTDSELLQAALIGYQSELTRIQQAMAEIQRQLEPSTGIAEGPATRPRRKRSAAVRKRMAAAQKKRWAENNQAKEVPTKKRKLSAAGRKRIVEATKKRWAAVRAQKAAAQEAAARKPAVKKVKPTKKRTGSAIAAPAASKVESPATT